MTERDWRIFREDHNISYKGSLDKSCLPIRSWDEANLPKPLLQACLCLPSPPAFKCPLDVQLTCLTSLRASIHRCAKGRNATIWPYRLATTCSATCVIFVHCVSAELHTVRSQHSVV